MNIPSCLNLRADQIEKLTKWKSNIPPMSIKEHDEAFGGACFCSGLKFNIMETSISTEIYVEYQGQKCILTIDDDNEICD